jgi:hypothetical protein
MIEEKTLDTEVDFTVLEMRRTGCAAGYRGRDMEAYQAITLSMSREIPLWKLLSFWRKTIWIEG